MTNPNDHKSQAAYDQINIINSLLNYDLTNICFTILANLDSLTLSNCRLVCHQWRDFIDYNFFNLPRGIEWTRTKIVENALNKDFIPKETIANHEEEMYGIEADQDGVCVSTYSGSISYYEPRTLNHKWTTKLFTALLQHHMTELRVYAVCSDFDDEFTDSHLFILDRKNGLLLKKFESIHQDPIFGVRVFEDQFIATVSCAGQITFHEITKTLNEDTFEINVIKTEKTYTDLPEEVDGYTHLDCEGRKLISGSGIGQLILWDFPTGAKIKTFYCGQVVQHLKMNWPLVATCAESLRLDPGIKLFNIETETLIRHLFFDQCVSHVTFNKSMMLATGITRIAPISENEPTISKTHKIWRLDEVFDDSIDEEDLQYRELYSNSIDNGKTESSAILGSDVITTENNVLIKRAFWP